MATTDDLLKILNPADPSITGLIPLGATVAGGLVGLNGAGDASQHQAAGVDAATGTVANAGATIPGVVGSTLNQQKDLYNPYVTAGTGALNQLSAGINDGSLTAPFHYDQKDFENDPAYQFSLDQGNKNLYAQSAARGLSLSGGALRDLEQFGIGTANQAYGADYSRAENTFRANQQARIQALKDLTGVGLTATNSLASDVGHAGDQNVQGIEWTATQIADLQQAKADALAAGDVGKANAINSLVSQLGQTVSQNSAIAKLLKTAFPQSGADANGMVRQAIDTSGNAGALDQIATNPGLTREAIDTSSVNATSSVPQIAGLGTSGISAAIPALTGTGTAGAGTIAEGIGLPSIIGQTGTAAAETAAPAAGGGIGSAAIGFLTNPITIGVGAGILAVTALLKSQAHWEANTLVKDVQNPFAANLGKIVNGFDQALASGQLDKATAQQMRDQTAAVINDFNNKVTQFAQGGDDEKEAALNAMRTMAENFGARPDYPNLPSYDKILGKMDAEIAQLPEAA